MNTIPEKINTQYTKKLANTCATTFILSSENTLLTNSRKIDVGMSPELLEVKFERLKKSDGNNLAKDPNIAAIKTSAYPASAIRYGMNARPIVAKETPKEKKPSLIFSFKFPRHKNAKTHKRRSSGNILYRTINVILITIDAHTIRQDLPSAGH